MRRIRVVSKIGLIRTEVLETRSTISTRSFDGPGSIDGLPSYRLANGGAVNVHGEGFVDMAGNVFVREQVD